VDWGYAVQGHDDIMDNARVDFALGTVPDARADTQRWFFPLADADPKPGDRVWVHGYPEGTERLTQGIVSTPYLGGMELTLEDPITFGSSGSPVLDARGHVVGVITHMRATTPWDRESNHALFTPVSHLRLALAHLGVRLWSGGTPSLVL
jgi:V8-like Glu-specific endopeptidase